MMKTTTETMACVVPAKSLVDMPHPDPDGHLARLADQWAHHAVNASSNRARLSKLEADLVASESDATARQAAGVAVKDRELHDLRRRVADLRGCVEAYARRCSDIEAAVDAVPPSELDRALAKVLGCRVEALGTRRVLRLASTGDAFICFDGARRRAY